MRKKNLTDFNVSSQVTLPETGELHLKILGKSAYFLAIRVGVGIFGQQKTHCNHHLNLGSHLRPLKT